LVVGGTELEQQQLDWKKRGWDVWLEDEEKEDGEEGC
jgi:hypothetical protein